MSGKVWLDRTLRTSLDQSVPQIGAPAAWQAGLTGKGVTVAVLDSGVDDTHPDLAGQVVGTENFTQDPVTDTAGHGTHVASTIAGKGVTGYRGVAPDAKLLNGKVCNDFGGCQESDVLAGIEWAVAQRAKVVNLSLGGPGGDETDPLEEAIARYGRDTLFVVAAGNHGGYASVDSPGTAPAALTVGAVDRDDSLADFSGQGPAPGGAIKPDLTAPGVGIVAARASASDPQEPVGDRYARMSGTSMATPHVAGTAALLVQQHNTWSAAELKSALTSAAEPNPGLTAYEQGAGRVDAARVIGQTVTAETSGLSFGTARWPHADDEPVSRTLSYRNAGTEPVTLRLAPGFEAPAGALTLSASQVTVPAGGSAAVQVVSNTAHAGPDRLYSGRITATAGATRIVVPLVVDKEVESYDVAVRHLGPDGKPSATAFSSFWSLGTGRFYDATGTTTARLPKGRYLLDAVFLGPGKDFRRLIQPTFDVGRPAKLTIDAQEARPVQVKVPEADAKPFILLFGYERKAPNGDRLEVWMPWVDGFETLYLGRLGAGAPANDFRAFMVSFLARIHSDGTLRDTPYVYGLVDTRRGHFFDGLRRHVVQRRLAHVISRYDGQAEDWVLWNRSLGVNLLGIGGPVVPPARIDRYLEPGSWQQAYAGELSPARTYRAGQTVEENWPVRPPSPPAR